MRALARTSDVLVENYKLGTLGRYGLGYEDLRALNPRLIYCSITGFGQSGPYAHLPGYDFVFQGMSGLMSVTGQPEGAPGDEPMKMGVAIVDILTGRVGTGLMMLGLHVLGRLTWWMFGLGFLIWGAVGVWWLIDALLIPGWLRR